MSDAAVKVDPDFYNRRLLDTEINGDQSRRVYRNGGEGNGFAGGGGGSGGGIRMTNGFGGPELSDYLVRQHSLLGFYLSLRPRDEADAERNWGFPQPQRLAIAGVTIVVPLFLALFITGSWLWKACVISVVTVGARLGASFALRTFQDLEVSIQGYTVAMWPHMTLGALGLVALIWFVCAAASGTGWSTMWIAFSSLSFLVLAEVVLRACMWQFKWKAPAERFSFLKPWGDYMPVNSAPRATSYAPPRPASVLPSVHFDGGGGSDAINEGDNGTNEGDYGTNEGDYGTNEGDYGTNEGDYGTNEGDYGTTPGSEERMALSDEIGKAIGEDDFQSESV